MLCMLLLEQVLLDRRLVLLQQLPTRIFSINHQPIVHFRVTPPPCKNEK